MAKINRANFLRQLECVRSGLASKEIIEQSSCLVFKKGNVLTFNDEVSCRASSGLDSKVTGAVQAKPVLEILMKIADDEIDVEQKNGRMLIRGAKKLVKVNMDKDILLPLNTVDEPSDKDWRDLPIELVEAVNVVQQCAGKDENKFHLTCVHFHTDFVEAFDNFRGTRYRIKMGIQEPFLLKSTAVSQLLPLGITQIAETTAWVHFRNNSGVMLSCRRWLEQYPDMEAFFTVSEKSDLTSIPKGLKEAAEAAEVFSRENADNNLVRIQLVPGKLKITGEGVSGSYQEIKAVTYKGRPLDFFIAPALLREIVEQHSECQITDTRLFVKGKRWTFATLLIREEDEGIEETAHDDNEDDD